MMTRPMPDLAARLTHLADPAAHGVPDSELLRRFAETRDEAAFELLVWRHGSLVMGTCRRVLGRSADADDAFQAAFLVLARKAASVRRGESLGGWLHRVALRGALRLRAAAGRRARVETQTSAEPATHLPAPDDTAAVLDEEIGRLPDKLRVAFVLCELEGRTDAEAAEQIGCPKGTVLSRLSRARERLRVRLTRRGVTLGVGGVLAARPASVPAALLTSAVRGAAPFAAGIPDAAVSPKAAILATGVLRSMTASLLKPIAAVLAVAALGVGAVLAARDPVVGRPSVPRPDPLVAAAAGGLAPAAPRGFKLAVGDQKLVTVDEVLFSPDGKWVAAAGRRPEGDAADSAVAVFDAATGRHAHTFTKPDGVGAALAFPGDGKLFATANPGDNSVSVWEVGTWKERAKVEHALASDVVFSPDGKLLLTRSHAFAGMTAYCELKVWQADSGKRVFEYPRKGEETFESAVFSPDGTTLVVGTSGGPVRLLDAPTGKLRGEITPPEKQKTEAAFSPDGKKLLTWTAGNERVAGEAHGGVRLWDSKTGKLDRKFEGFETPAQHATFSPDGKLVVVLGRGGALRTWDAGTGKTVAAFKVGGAAYEALFLSFTADGSVLAVAAQEVSETATLPFTALYSLPAGKELRRLPGVEFVVFNHDGTAAAVVTAGEKQYEVTIREVADLVKAK